MRREFILACAGWCAIVAAGFPAAATTVDAAEGSPRKIVLIAGKKSHGPEGNGIHDYPWSVKLLKVMLDNSSVAEQVRVEYHLDGWPEDEQTLDDAAAIMIISDGRDGDLFEEAPHFLTEDRRKRIARQIARGCGFLTFHFSTFAPDKFADEILSWSGGYFDWEADGKRQWYSAIKTLDADVQLATPDHPVLRGVNPCKLREEFYYNLRFGADDKSLTPLWTVPAVEGRAEHGNVVAWAKVRPDGGHGFGTTCGHFYDNWQQADFRKMILNALLWSAQGDVPANGVEAKYFSHAEITAALAGKKGTERAIAEDKPIKALILTGHQYPGHLWKDTTPALKEALLKDSRIQVDVSENVEDLATDKIAGYDLLVFNYCNWEKPGLSDAAKAGFVKYLQDGGGLILIHFSNGAFHFSLPKAGDSDWPEYRKICRRVWDHTPNKSGHDAYGKFVVDIAKADHPITRGMEPFETIDELYFRQQGEEPIEVLLTAKSNVTGRAEPMAFVYEYGQGRVMQTVLGHAAESLRTPGAIELLRRSAAWVAQREPTLAGSQPAQKLANPQATKLVEGKFDQALDARGGGLTVAGHESFRQPPVTVECWAKLANKTNYNILIAQENKNSATHWELFSMVGSGKLTAYIPGYKPDHVASEADVTDDRWHHLAMIFEPKRVRLFVDGKQVSDQAIEFQGGKTVPGGLAIGQLVDKVIGCNGLIDDIRISQGVRSIQGIPDQPLPVDDSTLGLWRFDEFNEKTGSPDASKHQRPAAVTEIKPKKPSDNAFYHWSKDVVGFDWTEQDSVDNRWNQTDVGPFLASIVPMPGQPPVTKGLSIKVGDNASVCYDTQTMALRSAWTGGFLKFDPARYGIIASPQMDGEVQFLSSPDAGWIGNAVRFSGLDVLGTARLLAEVDGVPVQDDAEQLVVKNRGRVLCRTILPKAKHSEMRLRITRASDVKSPIDLGAWSGISFQVEQQSRFLAIPKNEGYRWDIRDGDVQLVLNASDQPQAVFIFHFLEAGWKEASIRELNLSDVVWEMLQSRRGTLGRRLSDPRQFSNHLLQVTTQGALGAETGPYQVDTLTIPFENKANALFFITGHDFFSNGDLAVCTVHGDVWRVTGVDRELKKLTWHRYATGLFQPLGLKILDDTVYVLGRDRITKLVTEEIEEPDYEDGFGHVIRYENFCDLYETSPGGHDYIACLETDPEGNFYFVHAKHGVQRVSKDGKKLETVATGLRNPNGLSVSPTGEITAAPQEGEWTPASAIFMVQPGNHFGYLGPKITPDRPLGYDPPLCWIPRLVDNSCAGQIWTPDESWGLPKNSLLHFSFGQCTTLLTLREQIDGQWQGGVIPLPWKFQSGLSRGRFNPHDGHLYVSGLKGWVTSAVQDGCLQRVRYVGGDVDWPVKMESYQNGIALTYGRALDQEAAEDPENYGVQACNYRYSQAYGSPDLRPSHPTVEGRDDWDVASATLLPDGKTVFLEIPDLTPVMQLVVNWSIQSAEKSLLANTYHGTIHRLPERTFAVPESSYRPRPGRLTKEEEAALVPGIVFQFRQESRQHSLPARLFACRFPDDQPPHSGLTPGEYTLHADCYLKAPLSGRYRFRVAGTTESYLGINDEPVTGAAEIRLHKGYNRVRFNARSAAAGPTVVRLLWSADSFAEEPVPPTAWFHAPQPSFGDLAQVFHGRELIETHHCARCHQSTIFPKPLSEEPPAPNLKDLSGRMTQRWLTAWLLNPRAVRPRAEMPALFDANVPADRQAAADLSAYLLQGEKKPGPSEALAPADAAGEILYEELGCIACHRFTPPAESDIWQRDSLHFTAEKFPANALIEYLRQPQQHHRLTRMPDFRLTESETATLAHYVKHHSTGRIEQHAESAAADAARGRKVYIERRCGQCHGPLEDAAPIPPPLELWKGPLALKRGCLAEPEHRRAQTPLFPFSTEDRAALRKVFSEPLVPLEPLPPTAQSDFLIRRLNCTACHHRDHRVSPRGEIIAEESDRGLPPAALPNLTWAGDKLQVDWMRKLFRGEHPRRIRPWLTARMPAFPAYAEDLSAGLAAEHGLGAERESMAPQSANDDLIEVGRRLTLKDQGLDCRQCHAVAGQQPTGDDKTKIAPGIDFAESKHRLRAEFYRRFVLDPPRHDVTIRMPKFALDGKTTQVVNVYEGDADRQFGAIWQYIQSLPDMPREDLHGPK